VPVGIARESGTIERGGGGGGGRGVGADCARDESETNCWILKHGNGRYYPRERPFPERKRVKERKREREERGKDGRREGAFEIC